MEEHFDKLFDSMLSALETYRYEQHQLFVDTHVAIIEQVVVNFREYEECEKIW